ncbi:MAG: hypothetical protein HYX41_01895 [Bdellovibrio sp.]|nr:hypothetical protein [Bdellovibrio sp.]
MRITRFVLVAGIFLAGVSLQVQAGNVFGSLAKEEEQGPNLEEMAKAELKEISAACVEKGQEISLTIEKLRVIDRDKVWDGQGRKPSTVLWAQLIAQKDALEEVRLEVFFTSQEKDFSEERLIVLQTQLDEVEQKVDQLKKAAEALR